METQSEIRVCFNASGFMNHLTPFQTVRMQIETHDGTAISKCNNTNKCNCCGLCSGNFDYSPINKSVSFTGEQPQCVDVQIVNDELKEEERYFSVDLIYGSVLLSSARVIIRNNSEFIRQYNLRCACRCILLS